MSNQGFQQLGECLRLRCGAALTVIVSTVLCWPSAVRADVQPVTQMGGPPELPHATFEETGLPNFTMPVGKPTFPDGTRVSFSGSGSGQPNSSSGAFANGPTSGATQVSGSDQSLTYTNADGTVVTLQGGSAAWRNNNPGNLVYNPYTQSLGVIGSNNGFAVFPDAATGNSALTSLLNTSTYQNLSIDAAIARYAPAFENNTSAYQSFVNGTLGVSGSTQLSSLSPAQMGSLQSAIVKHEGYLPGLVRQGAG